MSDNRTSTVLNRRRFLAISASALAGVTLAHAPAFAAPEVHRWTGIALGAKAEINLLHDDPRKAKQLFAQIEAEIRRLEGIFSLYKAESELVRLNRDGKLPAPSLELVELLGLARQIHGLTGGAFDPSVQPLWEYHAHQAMQPGQGDRTVGASSRLALVDFANVAVDPSEITYQKPGMSMTLNGIAQGFITDRVAALLKSHGCTDVVVDLGEISANGRSPAKLEASADGWPVTLRPDPLRVEAEARVILKDAAVASSARQGTTFDDEAQRSHILDPRTGLSVENNLEAVSVIARSAAMADGLSTAALVLGEQGLREALRKKDDIRAFLLRADGSTDWVES